MSLALCVIGALLTSAESHAAPLQLNFQGQWSFYDPPDQSPDFWAAMAAAGIGVGTPISFSMIVDDRDTNPDPTIGVYDFFSSQLNVGSLSLSSPPTTLTVTAGAPLTGDVNTSGTFAGPSVGSYLPTYMQFTYFFATLPSDRLTDVLPVLNDQQRNALFIGFSGPCFCMGVSSMTLTSVQSVPEWSGLGHLAVGFSLATVAFLRHRPWRHTRSRRAVLADRS